MEFTVSGTTVRFDERTMQFAFTRDGAEWNTCADFKPTLQCAQGTFAFADATSITHEQRETGTGTGIRSIFTGFGHSAYSFETYVWVERASGDVLFEWIPLNEQGLNITNVTWPAAMDFDCADDHDTTLITHEQGVMIPNTWPTAVSTKDIAFDGRFETAGGYMPWFAQLRADGHGYIAICETPWNAGYGIDHPSDGPYTHINTWFEPSLGTMNYRRVVRYQFLDHADHAAVCKAYRSYVNERGRLRTLAERRRAIPSVRDLIGRSWVHTSASKPKCSPTRTTTIRITLRKRVTGHLRTARKANANIAQHGCRPTVHALGWLGTARIRQRTPRLSAGLSGGRRLGRHEVAGRRLP